MLRALTLADFCQRYLAEREDVSARYAEELRRTVCQFQAVCGAVPIGQITREHLINFLGCAPHWAAETHNNKRRMLLTLLRAAADLELCDVPRRVPRATPLVKLPTAWTLSEVTALLRVAGQQPNNVGTIPARLYWPALILFCFDTGCRIGQALRTPCCNLCSDPLAVLLSGETAKTRRARWCPLSQQAGTAISALMTAYPAPPRLAFGWPHSRRWFFRRFRRIVETAGLPSEKQMGLFHRLRRTSSSMIEAAGGDGARFLGNSRSVFERSYLCPQLIGRGQVNLLLRP